MRLPACAALAALALPLAALPGAVGGQPPGRPVLTWPVDCQVGTSCEIQHYIDHDPGAGVKDYACGNRTYDGHDGVDIRLADMAAEQRGVAVLAAAPGRVLRVRDGVEDVSVRAAGPGSVAERECGNAAVIAHAGGWESQYCHMAKGSVTVKPGDAVVAGQPIGKVGLSGLTEFPHLHFTVRENGRMVDPFAYGAPDGTCSAGTSLWAKTPPYEARVVLNAGFTDAPLTLDSAEAGGLRTPGAEAGMLIAYVRAIGLKAGDVQAMTVRGPDGSVLVQDRAAPLPRDQALRLMFIGKRRPAQGWPRGRYQASYTVAGQGGGPALTRTFDLTM